MYSWYVRQSFFLILCHFWRYFFLHIFIYPIIYFTVLGTIFTQENSPRTKWLIRVKKKDLGFSRVLSLVSSQWTRGEKQDVGHHTVGEKSSGIQWPQWIWIIMIRIQDLKKFVSDLDPDWTLMRIRIQTLLFFFSEYTVKKKCRDEQRVEI